MIKHPRFQLVGDTHNPDFKEGKPPQYRCLLRDREHRRDDVHLLGMYAWWLFESWLMPTPYRVHREDTEFQYLRAKT